MSSRAETRDPRSDPIYLRDGPDPCRAGPSRRGSGARAPSHRGAVPGVWGRGSFPVEEKHPGSRLGGRDDRGGLFDSGSNPGRQYSFYHPYLFSSVIPEGRAERGLSGIQNLFDLFCF